MEFQPSRGNNNNNVPGHFWAICLRIASPVPLPFPACYHFIVPTGVVVKQIPARLQSQHCKQFDQTLYGCTCKKEIENSPFPAPYQALSVVVPLSLSGSAYPRICGGIPHMTVYLTVYMSWRTASTSVCTYRLLIRRVVPKC